MRLAAALTSLAALAACAPAPSQPPSTGPITATPGEWTFIEFDDALCANGSTAGLGIDLREGSADAVIYLMGGGACWDELTCKGLGTAWNTALGYDAARFANESLKATDAFAPFPGLTRVLIPYCTGDLHSGTAERSWARHVGARNLDAFLARLSQTLHGRVFVVGTSAGGYGALLQAGRFAAAFPTQEVHFMADSAPMVAPKDKLDGWVEAWGAQLKPQVPPGSRVGLVASRRDWLISAFTGLDPDELEAREARLVDEQFRTEGRAAFIVEGNQHVFFDHLTTPGLLDWLTAWREGSSGFRTTPQ